MNDGMKKNTKLDITKLSVLHAILSSVKTNIFLPV